MRIDLSSFRGEAPRLTPRALPLNGAQIAKNARLQSGDLEAWRHFYLNKILANTGAVETIYLLNGEWLSWTADVDVARGIIPGDDTFRIYLTGPDLYDQPRWTNFALATTGDEPFPVDTRPLGVPNPDTQPSLVVGVSTNLPAAIDVLDNGDQIEAWTLSPQVPGVSTVSEDPAVGNGPPSYTLVAINNLGDAAWLHRDFGTENASVAEISFDFRFNNESLKRMLVNFLADENGAGIFVNWGETGQLNLGISTVWSSFGDSVLASANLAAPSGAVWYTCAVNVVANTDNTKTVNVTISNGSVQLGQLSLTNTFAGANGGHLGPILHVGAVPASEFRTWYDNISVRASIAATLNQIATSYVYTFVNDIGEESGPSPASATVLKDDGTAITVTTPTAIPSGINDAYGVETKRIYRAVTGNTGTAFFFVAEIPLAQADYVDELTDSELGDALESEGWALPPDDMRGIIALPNGIMAGFRRNQLCLSAQNRPHAWPVNYRLNTDTDIVAIGNIDNTVVIGTEAFPYTATGNDPAAYSMTKLEKPQACVSKRSLAYLTDIGVVFASPDGLIAIAGNGRITNITDSIFTRRQWQDLEPESILGVAHDDVYHFFSGALQSGDGGDTRQGRALDMKPNGFGLIELSYHAAASYADPLTDQLYLVLDLLDEPTSPYLPLPSAAPTNPDIVTRQQSYTEDYADGFMPPYALVFGDVTKFQLTTTPYGLGMQLLQDAVLHADAIQRDIPPITLRQATIDFVIDDAGDDDGGVLEFRNDGSIVGAFITRREAAFDALKRARAEIGAESIVASPSALTLDVWYTATLVIAEGAGNSSITIREKVSGTLVQTTAFASDHTPPETDALRFHIGASPALSAPTTFGEINILGDQIETSAIYEFDSPNAAGDLVYQWKGKLNRLPNPAAFTYCQVKASDLDNFILNLYGDEGTLFSEVISNAEPFTLPMLDRYETFEIELIGTSRIESVRIAETVEELMQEG